MRKILFAVLFLPLLISSCSQEETKGVITVLDLNTKAPISSANVLLSMENPSNGFFLCADGFTITKSYSTNGSGKVEICFKHPSVINIDVSHSGKTGKGRLSLQEGETTNLTIYLSN
jgi:hypothetical protein